MSKPDSPIVGTDWLNTHLSDPDVLVVDVRPAMAYQMAHIPGAISLDLTPARLSRSTPDALDAWRQRVELLVQAAGIRRDHTVVFLEDISGTTAAYGVWLLDAAGLGNGHMLDGGIQAWHREGLPLTQDPTIVAPSDTVLSFSPEVVATLDGLTAELAAPETSQRIDTRATAEYQNGAIPGAFHVDWTRHLNPETGSFRPLSELRELYADLDPEQPTTTYCAGGFRAANSYVVLKALGFSQPRTYVPSWGEWGMHPSTPKQ